MRDKRTPQEKMPTKNLMYRIGIILKQSYVVMTILLDLRPMALWLQLEITAMVNVISPAGQI